MDRDLSASSERLYEPAEMDRYMGLNLRAGGPDALAEANRRDEREYQFYRAHPRAYAMLARIPLWRRW